MKPKDATRFWAKVDKAGDCWNWTGTKNLKGYGFFWLDGKMQFSHRVAYSSFSGPLEPGKVIDHQCHNSSCVRPDHLRQVTVKGNQENRAGAQCHNPTGVRGVRGRNGRWVAYLRHNGRQIHLGTFDSQDAAERAVSAGRNQVFSNSVTDRSIAALEVAA